MLGITLTADQIKSAPADVRHWIELQIDAALGRGPAVERPSGTEGLAICSSEELRQIFEAVKDDFLACQLLFELGREQAAGTPFSRKGVYAISIAEIMRHTKIGSEEQLAGCFAKLDAAFQAARKHPEAYLFAFDERGICYLHAETHSLIHRLWLEFTAAQMEAVSRHRAAPPLRPNTPPSITAAAPYRTGAQPATARPESFPHRSFEQ